MIDVKVTVARDGTVQVVGVLGFDEPNLNESICEYMNQILVEESGWAPEGIPRAVASQISRLARYLLENYFLRDSRIVIYRGGPEISRIEYRVATPDSPLSARPTRFEHEPVI